MSSWQRRKTTLVMYFVQMETSTGFPSLHLSNVLLRTEGTDLSGFHVFTILMQRFNSGNDSLKMVGSGGLIIDQ